MALRCGLCLLITFVALLGVKSSGTESCAPDDALHLLQHRVTSLIGQNAGKDVFTDSNLLDTNSEWPSTRLRLCQRKADEVTYGMKVVALKHNNLGNRGPDTGAHEMRFAVEVTSPNQPTKSVDFVLVNTSFYLPFNTVRNNLYPGDKEYFMINVWEGGSTEIAFKGTFVESDTDKEVKMKDIYVTYYDIDQQTQRRVERLYVKDFWKYSVSQTSVLQIQQQGEWTVIRPPYNQVGGVHWDPNNLSPAALDQSILLHYRETSSFEFKTMVAGEVIASGRNYMMAIHSALTECPNGFVCDIFGDPHISAFDNAKPVLLDDEPNTLQMNTFDNMALARDDFHDGDMWLVKSEHVLIQGRYGKTKGTDKSFLKAVAIGGPFLHGNTLVLASAARSCLWNQEEILTSLGSTHVVQFEDGGLVKASYQSGVRHIHMANQTTDGVEVQLPMGVKLFLNRFKTWLGLRIHLHAPIEGGQDGECGNINGDPDDDSQLMVQRRMNTRVRLNETLFVGRYASHRAEEEEEPLPQTALTKDADVAGENETNSEAFVSEDDVADVTEQDGIAVPAAEDEEPLPQAVQTEGEEPLPQAALSEDALSNEGDAQALGTEDDVLAAEDEAENLPQPEDEEMLELADEQDANAATADDEATSEPQAVAPRPHLLPRVAGRPAQALVSEQEAASGMQVSEGTKASEVEDSYANYYTSAEKASVEHDSNAQEAAAYSYY